jgi:hypothetical protein
MALKVVNLDVEGTVVANAHIRVIRLWADPDANTITGHMGIWTSRNAWINGKKPLEQFNISAPYQAACAAALYDAVLLDPRFSTAVTE